MLLHNLEDSSTITSTQMQLGATPKVPLFFDGVITSL